VTPCVLWTKYRNRGGYGVTGTGSRTDGSRRSVLAHRLAWEKMYGLVPDGLAVLHRCDVPSCVNVEHLFLGTWADNNHDRDAKGRTARGPKTNSPLVKITQAKADRIRELAVYLRNENGRLVRDGRKQIALTLGISERIVKSVLAGESWHGGVLVG